MLRHGSPDSTAPGSEVVTAGAFSDLQRSASLTERETAA